jgi:hypothetical protein
MSVRRALSARFRCWLFLLTRINLATLHVLFITASGYESNKLRHPTQSRSAHKVSAGKSSIQREYPSNEIAIWCRAETEIGSRCCRNAVQAEGVP